MYYDRAQLKREVKLSMKQSRPSPMLVTLLYLVVAAVGSSLLNTLLGRLFASGGGDFTELVVNLMQRGYEADEALEKAVALMLGQGAGYILWMVLGSMVVSFLVSLWQGVMGVGYCGYCLSMTRGESPSVGRIFCSFQNVMGVLVTRLLTGIFIFLWTAAAMLGAAAAVFLLALTRLLDVPILGGLLGLAVMVGLVLLVIRLTLRYALVDYVLLDKGLSGMDAIGESKRLMRGSIGKAFVLQLSFLGWYLLLFVGLYVSVILGAAIIIAQVFGGASMGGLIAASGVSLLLILAVVVGAALLYLWLFPYVTGAMARFYDWANASADGIGGGPGFGAGGWSGPQNYTRTNGPVSGTGIGPGGGSAPRSPKPPRDDPWN